MNLLVPVLACTLMATPSQEVKFKVQDLHPAFRFTTEDVNRYVSKGSEYAKKGKKETDLMSDNTKKPRGTKGEKGTSHESFVICLDLYGSNISYMSFDRARKYEKNDIAERLKNGVFLKRLDFAILLVSEPKVAETQFDRSRTAKESDVKVIKFVLTDEKDNVIASSDPSLSVAIQKGSISFSGNDVIPETVRESGTGSTSGGIYGDVNLNYNSNSSYTKTKTKYNIIPWSVEKPYYKAEYDVSFPLFDENGDALIKATVKKIKLKIVLENGERMVEYELKK